MRPLVSVVMPIFNGQQYLAEAIQSVLNQSFADFELIVIDDGSVDGSRKIVQEFMATAPQTSLLCQENGGVSAARNSGILASNGRYIAFLDQDDRWTPEALQIQVSYHQSHPEIGYTLAHQICFLEAGSRAPAWFHLQQVNVPHVGYLPGTLMVNRPLFDTLGLFDTKYPISSDADWFARAKDANIPTHTLPQVILERRIHNENQSQQSQQIHGELFQLLRASIKRKRQQQHESDSG